MFLSVTALGLLAAAAWALSTGQTAAGAALAASGVFLGHVAGLGLSGWYTPRRAAGAGVALTTASDGERGLVFRYSRWPYYWLTAVLTMTVLGLAAVAVIGAVTATAAGFVTAVAVGVLASVVGWFLAVVLRLAPGRITVTPTAVHHRGLTFTHTVPWYAIFAVDAERSGTALVVAKAFPSDDTRVRRYSGRFGTLETQLLPYLAVRAHWLAADPGTVLNTLAFYHAHPDHRTELGTPASLDRVDSPMR